MTAVSDTVMETENWMLQAEHNLSLVNIFSFMFYSSIKVVCALLANPLARFLQS